MTEQRQTRAMDNPAMAATHILGLVPFVQPLAGAIGPFGLEPRLRELVILSVVRGNGCQMCIKVHNFLGRLAGLSDQERAGHLDELTPAERCAISIALRTVSLPSELGTGSGQSQAVSVSVEDGPDYYFTSEEIEQIKALALGADVFSRCRNSADAALAR